MKNYLSISLIQSILFWKDVDANISHFKTIISSIKDTDIILLPEMFNTAFCPKSNHLAESMHGKILNTKNLRVTQLLKCLGCFV